jgi:hypothetical protein
MVRVELTEEQARALEDCAVVGLEGAPVEFPTGQAAEALARLQRARAREVTQVEYVAGLLPYESAEDRESQARRLLSLAEARLRESGA